jgi:tetratricopeptide (TPR) repeat protein
MRVRVCLRKATRFLQFPLLLAMIGLPSAAQDSNLLLLYRDAQTAQAAGQLAIATEKYEAIVRMRPDMAEAFANLGNLYYQQGKRDLAAPAYKKAIQLKPALTGPYFFLGEIAFSAHAYPEALTYLKRAETLEPENPLVRSYLGYTYYAQASYENAARQLEQAAALDPSDQEIIYHLSKAYSHLAQSSLLELKKHFPDSFYTNLARAHYDETMQDWGGAAGQYSAALEKKPGNARLIDKAEWAAVKASGKEPVAAGVSGDQLVDGSLLYLYSPPQGESVKAEFLDRQKAAGVLRAAPMVTPEHYYQMGESYQTLSYLASLLVVAMDPKSSHAHLLQAQYLESTGKEEEAIGEYTEVLRGQAELPNIHFAIGNLHWKNQRFADAKTELLQELLVNPNHPQALYELGDIALTAGNDREAEQRYGKALKYEPNMVEAHFALEKIYTGRGDYGKSVPHLRAAIQIDPTDPTPHYRLSQIYRKLNQSEDSQKELRLFTEKRAKATK